MGFFFQHIYIILDMSSLEPNTAPTVFIDSTDLLYDTNALQKRAREDGYLFFRQLLPKEEVLKVRQDLLEIVARQGWLASGKEGRINVEAINRIPQTQMREVGVSQDAYNKVQKQESMHRLPHHPQLLALYKTLFQRDVFVHPRHIVRLVTPHASMVPTPPHQDFPHIQGTPNTWTCWFPLGNCPRSLGGLTVLRHSHNNGYLPIQPSVGAGNIAVELCPHEQDWVEGDFEAGDVLTFASFTIHKALPSQQTEILRLSMDVRYQPADEPIEEKSLLPHCELSWEEIYAEWAQDDLQYYWYRNKLPLAPWEPAYFQPGHRIC